MKFDVNINLSGMNARLSRGQLDKAQLILTERAAQDSNQYTPRDTGHLQDDTLHIATRSADEFYWSAPYAKRVYYLGQQSIHTEKNPQARSHWFDFAKSQHLGDWKKAVEEALR